MGHYIKSLLICVCFAVTGNALAQEKTIPQPVIAGVYPEVNAAIPLFAEESTLQLEIVSDFKKILSLPEKDTATKVPAKLIYQSEQGAKEIEINLSTRGASKLMFCNFRPLRIYFDTKTTDLSQTAFKGVSEDLKLATHCNGLGKVADTDWNIQQILREQTAYKMLSALGFMSMKTRSAFIIYKNLDGSIVAQAQAFFLEPKSNMAKRYGLKHIYKIKADVIYAPEPENKIAFNLSTRFLMHTDVDFGGQHNTILLIRDGEAKASSMIPYDFDLTGMVIDAKYQGTAHAYRQWTLEGWGDDGDWLTKQVSAPYTSESYRSQTYNLAAYALSHKEDVQRVIDQSPVLDKTRIQERVNTFFSGFERALSAK